MQVVYLREKQFQKQESSIHQFDYYPLAKY